MSTQTGSASGLQLVYGVTRARIGALQLDASVEEEHAGEVEVSEHEVEVGANISDHAREKPETIRISGVVSNTPIAESDRRDQEGRLRRGSEGRADSAYDALRKIKSERQPVTVVTSLRQYENMVMTSLSVPRDAERGDSLHFTAAFKQIRTVASETVRVELPRAQKKLSGGKKTTTAASEATTKKVRESLLRRGTRGVTNRLASMLGY